MNSPNDTLKNTSPNKVYIIDCYESKIIFSSEKNRNFSHQWFMMTKTKLNALNLFEKTFVYHSNNTVLLTKIRKQLKEHKFLDISSKFFWIRVFDKKINWTLSSAPDRFVPIEDSLFSYFLPISLPKVEQLDIGSMYEKLRPEKLIKEDLLKDDKTEKIYSNNSNDKTSSSNNFLSVNFFQNLLAGLFIFMLAGAFFSFIGEYAIWIVILGVVSLMVNLRDSGVFIFLGFYLAVLGALFGC